MKSIETLFFGFLWCCILLSCSGSPTSEGSATETVNTFAVLSSGEPAEDAVVRLIDADSWFVRVSQGAVPDEHSTTVGADGLVRFDSQLFSDQQQYNLLIQHPKEGFFRYGMHASELSDDTLRLAKLSSYSIELIGDADNTQSVLLAGTPFKAARESGPKVVFYAIPEAVYSVLTDNQAEDARQLKLAAQITVPRGTMVSDTLSIPAEPATLVDNFDSGEGVPTLHHLFQHLFWYAFSDSMYIFWDNAERRWNSEPNLHGDSGKTVISMDFVSDGNTGQALRFRSELSPAIDYPYAGFGLPMRNMTGRGANVSKLDSITLRVKGKGRALLRMETDALQKAEENFSHFSYEIVLDENWQSLTIPVSQLSPIPDHPEPGQYSWEAVSTQLNQLEFEFLEGGLSDVQTVEMVVDDIVLHGVSISDLVEKGN